MMQRLSVQVLCTQLENTWTYFNRTFKMQDHLYVQYVELNQFKNEFRELANKFNENEKIIKKLPMSGSSLEEVNAHLDKLDNVIDALSVDVHKAKNLSKAGFDLITDHSFARDCLEPKCVELKILCKRQEVLFFDKRRTLLKFLDLFEGLMSISKWCSIARQHISQNNEMSEKIQEDAFSTTSKIRQIDYLLSKLRDLRFRSRLEFDDQFDVIKNMFSKKLIIVIEDHFQKLEGDRAEIKEKRELLSIKCLNGKASSTEEYDDNYVRRENIIQEFIDTEERYVDDLKSILTGYRDRMLDSNSNLHQHIVIIFGNLDEIYKFHSECLLPELERCRSTIEKIAQTFIELSDQLRHLYCRYCQNMESARNAVAEVGENNPLIINCQQELGHQLPLSSYLLKPVQRLTKYQLLLKDLSESSSNALSGRLEIEESLEAMLTVIRDVNDSLHQVHQVNIRGLPEVLYPLGTMLCQDSFLVLTENKSQSQMLFRNKYQKRQVFLYENYLIFCKHFNERSGPYHQFKFSLGASNIGMTRNIKSGEKKIELWIVGQSDVYTLEAKTKQSKEHFADQLKNVITKHTQKMNSETKYQEEFNNDNQLSETQSIESRRSHISRSRSLDHEGRYKTHRSHSLDPYKPIRKRESSKARDAELIEKVPVFQVLADYEALTTTELNLKEGQFADLIKYGCSGWWYIKLRKYPFSEGWVPSTYLEKIV